MLLAVCVCARAFVCARVCVASSQNCATVNRQRGTEVTLPPPPPPPPPAGSINSDTHTHTQRNNRATTTTHTTCHCTCLLTSLRAIKRRRQRSAGPLWRASPLRSGSLWSSLRGLEGPRPFTLLPADANQTQQRKHTGPGKGAVGVCVCVCVFFFVRTWARRRGRHQKEETARSEERRAETLTQKAEQLRPAAERV